MNKSGEEKKIQKVAERRTMRNEESGKKLKKIDRSKTLQKKKKQKNIDAETKKDKHKQLMFDIGHGFVRAGYIYIIYIYIYVCICVCCSSEDSVSKRKVQKVTEEKR